MCQRLSGQAGVLGHPSCLSESMVCEPLSACPDLTMPLASSGVSGLPQMRKTRTLTEIIVEAENVIANPAQNIKIHPELPRRPSPPNALFYEENLARFHAQHPRMSYQKLFQLLSNKYKALPEEEKSLYEEKFNLANEEYKRKMLEFRKHYDNKSPNDKSKMRRKKKRISAGSIDEVDEDTEGLPPKPPFNGYHLFCKEQRASMVGVSKNSYVSIWAQRWRDLTERERNKYSTRCTELKRQYAVELNDFLMTLEEKEQERIINKYGIKRPKKHKLSADCTAIKREVKYKKLPGEPKMPSRSGNVIFCKEQMQLLKEEYPNSRERFIKCNHMWQHLPNKEKERYKGKVCENFQKYSMELQKWFKDSEDEDIEDCSSDEEEDYEEDEEEEEEGEEDNKEEMKFGLCARAGIDCSRLISVRCKDGCLPKQGLAQDILSDLVEDACLGLCFEVHRAVKQGYFFLDDTDQESMRDFEIVDQPGLDVFGQVYNQWKNKECVCPNCSRSIAASRFAPHLEKCLGMGRNSSRIANRRIVTGNNTNNKSESDQEDNDDVNDNDWSYGAEKKAKKRKSDKCQCCID
ncbi:hypothetical protein L3Q82_001025 [Scortum barcoo]|uniref:Uncharacterized protein n=1 Tax=Scortum barcoo TaxID=214431 RepID=A0ACB8WDM0_9TELE|nr:hypothetical protein L3Q82_001025 [Scortum barcoo]